MKHLSKSNPEDKSPRIALALGSGASRGWSHIGVIKALAAMGVQPHVVAGCSIGSIVGAALASGRLEHLEQWVLSLSKTDVARFFELNWRLNGVVDVERLRSFMSDVVVGDNPQIEDLTIDYAAVATDLGNGREIWFTEGSVLDAIMASIALPGLFAPVQYNNRWLIDGGLVNPVPVSLCHAMGADLVIAVNLNGDILGKHLNPKKENNLQTGNEMLDNALGALKNYSNSLFDKQDKSERPPGLMDIVASAINITQDRITRSRMAGDPPDIHLVPFLSHISLLDFDRAEEAIIEGEQCVERMKPAIEFALERL